MPKRIDLTGQRFGKLLVVQCAGNDINRRRVWLCRCDCGGQSIVAANNLRTGNTKSCGCMRLVGILAKVLASRVASSTQPKPSY